VRTVEVGNEDKVNELRGGRWRERGSERRVEGFGPGVRGGREEGSIRWRRDDAGGWRGEG